MRPTYVMATNQVGICPTGSIPIRTTDECETAAEYLGDVDTSIDIWEDHYVNIPSGCWIYNNQLYFNYNPDNWNFAGDNGHVFVICKTGKVPYSKTQYHFLMFLSYSFIILIPKQFLKFLYASNTIL